MPEVSLVDGTRAFTVDPGRIAPAVLRAMWAGLHSAIPGDLAARLDAAAGLVGLAGVWSALTQDQRVKSALVTAARAAVEGVDREPERWRSVGSQMVMQALYVAGDQSTESQASGTAPAAPSSVEPQTASAVDPRLPTHYRYQGKLVARSTGGQSLPSS